MLAKKLLSPVVKIFGDKRSKGPKSAVEEQEERLAKYAQQLTGSNNCSVPKRNLARPKKRFSESNISLKVKNPIIILKD